MKKILGDTLPNYMVPTVYLQLKKMPLTLNGKIDVKSLPEATRTSAKSSARYFNWKTSARTNLSSTWAERFYYLKLASILNANTLDNFRNGRQRPLGNIVLTGATFTASCAGAKICLPVRSKFLAERAILDAVANDGLKAKIMRVGTLSARYSDGEFQINAGTNSSHMPDELQIVGIFLD